MAENELQVQGVVHGPECDGRTAVGGLPVVHDLVQPDHAKPEHAKGLPGKPESGADGVLCSREQERHVLPERRGGSAADGDQDDALAEPFPEHSAMHSGDVRRFVERPEPEAETVYAVTNNRRTGAQRRPGHLRVLLLRAAYGGSRRRRVGPVRRYRWPTNTDARRVRVRGGHKHREFIIILPCKS